VEFSFVVGEESVGLVSSVVLGAETPVNVWEDRLFFEVYCAEDAAAYFFSLLPMLSVEKKGVYLLLVHFWLKIMCFNGIWVKSERERCWADFCVCATKVRRKRAISSCCIG
jgi:hypothetical protein